MSDPHEKQVADVMAIKGPSQEGKHVMMAMVALDRSKTPAATYAADLSSGTGIPEFKLFGILNELEAAGFVKVRHTPDGLIAEIINPALESA